MGLLVSQRISCGIFAPNIKSRVFRTDVISRTERRRRVEPGIGIIHSIYHIFTHNIFTKKKSKRYHASFYHARHNRSSKWLTSRSVHYWLILTDTPTAPSRSSLLCDHKTRNLIKSFNESAFVLVPMSYIIPEHTGKHTGKPSRLQQLQLCL